MVSAGGGHPPGPALYLGLPTVRSSFTAPQAFDGHSIRDGHKGKKKLVVAHSLVFMASFVSSRNTIEPWVNARLSPSLTSTSSSPFSSSTNCRDGAGCHS